MVVVKYFNDSLVLFSDDLWHQKLQCKWELMKAVAMKGVRVERRAKYRSMGVRDVLNAEHMTKKKVAMDLEAAECVMMWIHADANFIRWKQTEHWWRCAFIAKILLQKCSIVLYYCKEHVLAIRQLIVFWKHNQALHTQLHQCNKGHCCWMYLSRWCFKCITQRSGQSTDTVTHWCQTWPKIASTMIVSKWRCWRNCPRICNVYRRDHFNFYWYCVQHQNHTRRIFT